VGLFFAPCNHRNGGAFETWAMMQLHLRGFEQCRQPAYKLPTLPTF